MTTSSVYKAKRDRSYRELWDCTSCNCSFSSFDDWTEHIQAVHMSKLVCCKCNLKFILLTDAIQHQRDRHLRSFFQCGECEHSFFTKAELTAHDCNHKDERCIATGFFIDSESGRYYSDCHRGKNRELIFQKCFFEDLPDYESIKAMMGAEAEEYREWCRRICSDE